MPNWKKVIVSGSGAELTTLKLTGTSGQSSEATSLMIDGTGVVGTRELGSNAFNSTAFLENLNGALLTTTNQTATGVKTFSSGIIIGNADFKLSNPPAQSSEATSLMINTSGIVGTRELGSNAFNSTAFLSSVDLTSDVSTTILPIANGGTEAANASDARDNLGAQAQGDVLDDLNALGAAASDGQFIVATGAGTFAYESGATARTSLGLKIGADVQAYSATLDSVAASTYTGDNNITTLGTIGTGTWSATNIALDKGGTGASLADPNDDRILFWDDSAGSVTWLDIGTNLSISGNVLNATAGGGSGYEWFDGTTYATASVDVSITGSVGIYKSGSTVFSVDGSEGRLFEVTDQLSGSLFSVNDISGIPVFEVFSDDTVKIGTHNTEGIIVYGDYAEFQAGAASTPSIRFDGANADTGFYSSGADTINASTNNTQRFTLSNNGLKLNNGSLGVGTANPNSVDGRIDASNDIVAYSSDKRLKENIKLIQNPLSKIDSLSGFTYNWNEKAEEVAGYDRTQSMVGVFAQDVESVLPEAVKTAPFDNDGEGGSISGENYLTVQYEKLVPLLIESIKELKAEIEELKGRI